MTPDAKVNTANWCPELCIVAQGSKALWQFCVFLAENDRFLNLPRQISWHKLSATKFQLKNSSSFWQYTVFRPGTPTIAEPYFRSRMWWQIVNQERKPDFLFVFIINHRNSRCFSYRRHSRIKCRVSGANMAASHVTMQWIRHFRWPSDCLCGWCIIHSGASWTIPPGAMQ